MFKFKTLFDVPEVSDVEIQLCEKTYHVISFVLKHNSPFFNNILNGIPDMNQSLLVSGQVNTKMVIIRKKIIILDPFNLDLECVINVLRNMYGEDMQINAENVHHILKIATQFQMESIISSCYKIIESDIPVESLIENYKNALATNHLLVPIYHKKFMASIMSLNKDTVLEFTTEFTPEMIKDLLKTIDQEDFKYDIAHNYCRKKYGFHKEEIMSQVNFLSITKEKLVNELRNHIRFDKYCCLLECHISPKQMHAELLKMKKYKYAIGKIDGEYDGYRIITDEDVNVDFLQEIKNKYNKNRIFNLEYHEDNKYGMRIGTSTSYLSNYFEYLKIAGTINNFSSLIISSNSYVCDLNHYILKLTTSEKHSNEVNVYGLFVLIA